MKPFVILTLLSILNATLCAQELLPLKTEKLEGAGVWEDPRIEAFPRNQFRITVWFEGQFLGDGKAYLRRTKEFDEMGRNELREKVIRILKALSQKSQASVGESLNELAVRNAISNLEFHWIVNGFSCQINRDALEEVKKIPGVRMIYFAGPAETRRNQRPAAKPVASPPKKTEREPFSPERFKPNWYITALKADQVWKEHKIAGEGVLNVIHDGNFILSPSIEATLFRNPNETENGKDDSGNGLINDIHGYDFSLNRPQLTRMAMPKNSEKVSGSVLHGHQCAAIICGKGTEESPHQFGIAPESQWAGVLASRRVEAAIEWAIEQGADTYSMSFSRPNLGDMRSHWRKMMEHGAFCGVHFVSGAGNFAMKGSPSFAPVPVQMRTPEDIPHVVFAAAGIQKDLSRTPFSSQGPVLWETAHYKDGLVDKPEVVAFNFRLPQLLPDGSVKEQASNGNSFAGPMFCGTIALMLSANPELKPWEVREIIISTARDVGESGYDHQTGHGLIDAYAAVSEAINRK